MTKVGWSTWMTLAAGMLTFAGSPSVAQDESGTSSAGSSSASSPSIAGNTDETQRGGAMGTATTEQQSRSDTSGQASDATGQRGSTESSGSTNADERQRTKTAAREPAGGEASSKEITGRVLQAGPSKLFLEHMGAVVEFNIAPDAQFSGGTVRSSRDLSEGQEVRASFTVENKTTNVAKRISLTREAGAPSPKR
jgi:hypothetical protein